ncbi:MAG: hypothetical protein JWN43_4287 [Gammaproteobacteria bacterium]|nr:hypothetical protein [Gammaproteobacteria bacterium]
MAVKHYSWVGTMLAAALVPHLAWAALGEPELTAADDAQLLKGSIKSTERTHYRVHEIQLPSGTVLREFAEVGGRVFAVAWTGPALPNMRQALGSYFDGYVAAAKVSSGGRHHFQMQQNGLVMQSSGHMRAFTGRAYLPAALPSGASVEEIH